MKTSPVFFPGSRILVLVWTVLALGLSGLTAAQPQGGEAGPAVPASPAGPANQQDQPSLPADGSQPDQPKKPEEADTWGAFPLIVPIYTPETRFMIAGGGIFWVDTWPEAPRKRISEVITFVTASQNDQHSFGLIGEAYAFEHRLKIAQNLDIFRQPNLFWGIGPARPKSGEEEYTPAGFTNRTSLMWMITSDIYLGPMWETRAEELEEFERGGLIAGQTGPGRRGAQVHGPGIHAVYDTRNSPFATSSGTWLELRAFYSEPAFGARGRFAQMYVDYRYFIPVAAKHVLALNGVVNLTAGNAPWQAYPRIGGQFLMRGYFYGRFIDRHLWTLQADYRMPLWWRFGLVPFFAVGNVTPSLDRPGAGGLKTAGGLGLRILVDGDQGINMRLDTGVSNEGDVNFYFTFKEAF